jgi:hypothetical protein
MAHYITEVDWDLINQTQHEKYIRIELLDDDFNTIKALEGNLIDDSFTIDAEASIRRTINLTFHITDDEFLVGQEYNFWFNKFIRVYYGIYHEKSNEIIWYKNGTYYFTETSYQYDEVTKSITLNCADGTVFLDNTLNGQIGALTTTIPAIETLHDFVTGETTEREIKLREVVVSVISELAGLKEYIIEDEGLVIPYDLNFPVGCTINDIVIKLRDLYPKWEAFFDIDGVFVFRPYPYSSSAPIYLDDRVLQRVLIEERQENDLSNVRNISEVWGSSLSSDRYTEDCVTTGNKYTLTFDGTILTDQEKIPSGLLIAFLADQDNKENQHIEISDLSYPIVDAKGNALPAGTIKQGVIYVVKYYNEKFYFWGQSQIHAIWMELANEPTEQELANYKQKFNCNVIGYTVNPESPYCVEYIGEKKATYSGDEYSNIYSDQLALERAEYENYQTTRLKNAITLTTLHMPWVDVNQKIEYTSQVTGKTDIYIINSITGSSSEGTMTMNCIKYYPLYQED